MPGIMRILVNVIVSGREIKVDDLGIIRNVKTDVLRGLFSVINVQIADSQGIIIMA